MDYKKQAFLNMAGNVIYLFAQWLLTVAATHILGIGAAGTLTLAISAGNIFYFIQMYGMRSYQVSDVTESFCTGHYIFSRYLTVSLGIVVCVIYLMFAGYSKEKSLAVFLYMLYRTFEAISDAYYGELQKKERLDIFAMSMAGRGVLTILLFEFIAKFTGSLNAALGIICVISFATTFFYDERKYRAVVLPKKMEGQWCGGFRLLRECFLLFLVTLFPVIITSMPRIVLERYYGTELLGYYGNISTPTVLITAIVPNLLMPFMTLYGTWNQQHKTKSLMKGYLISIILTSIFGVFCLIGAWVCGSWVMTWIYTKAIAPYVKYLYPMILETTVYALGMCGNSILISLRKSKVIAAFAGTSLVICVVIVNFLVQSYGINGAILSMGVAYGVQFLCQMVYILHFLKHEGKQT